MPVHFLIGRAGSGKSRVCFERIVEMMRADPLGPPIYLIVPKQETFSAERELTCGSGLEGFCRTRVVSFELLGEQVLAECGGTAIPEVTELGRQMMLGHLLRKHEKELKYYGSSARRIGLAAALEGTFSELERSGRGAVELGNVLSDLKHEADDPSLLAKLWDLRLLYEEYLAYLGSERLDPHRRLEQVIAGLEKCRLIRGATVFVDGFLELFDWQRKMLVGLGESAKKSMSHVSWTRTAGC
jgi:ATP-dependent helicase/nuclease subunit B